MENDSKVAMGLAVAGICLGIGGLVFGFAARNQGEGFKSELAELQGLVDKIQRVEEDSNGLSANTTRLARDLETLRNTTQEALNRVSTELTNYRKDLNETIQTARKMGYQIEDIEETLATRPALPDPVSLSATETAPPIDTSETETAPPVIDRSDPEDESPNGSEPETTPDPDDADAILLYTVRAGDTFSSIASRHEISLDAILDANADIDPNRLQIGQEVQVPSR